MTYEGTKIQGKQAIAKHFQVGLIELAHSYPLEPLLDYDCRKC